MPATRTQRTLTHVPAPAGTNDPKPADALLKAALGFKSQKITVNIPEGATLGQVEETLQLAIGASQRLIEANESIKPVIGRILLTIQERRLFKPEYKSFTGFLQQVVVGKMGYGRTPAFEAIRVARAFPEMDAETYARYGHSRLLLAAQLVRKSEGVDIKPILDESTRKTVDEFKEQVAEMLAPDNGAPKVHNVVIRADEEHYRMWQDFLQQVNLTSAEGLDLLLTTFYHKTTVAERTRLIKPAAPKTVAV